MLSIMRKPRRAESSKARIGNSTRSAIQPVGAAIFSDGMLPAPKDFRRNETDCAANAISGRRASEGRRAWCKQVNAADVKISR